MAWGIHHKGVENYSFLAIDFAPLVAAFTAIVAVMNRNVTSVSHGDFRIIKYDYKQKPEIPQIVVSSSLEDV